MAKAKLMVSTANVFFSMVDSVCALFGKVRVREISTEELVQLRQEPNEPPRWVLVDVRGDAECAVSVIPGAITKAQFEAQVEADDQAYHDCRVISYCTVGGRSYVYTRQLLKQGFDAANFKSSILGWCEANQDLVTPGGEPTNRVHVYSSAFSVPDRYEATTTG